MTELAPTPPTFTRFVPVNPVPVIVKVEPTLPEVVIDVITGAAGGGTQLANLNFVIQVDQLKVPVEARYSVAPQKVQSSAGSTTRAE